MIGSLAQLVQSTCLTSRGSLVRIQQFPHLKSTTYSVLRGKWFFICTNLYTNLFSCFEISLIKMIML